MSLHGDLKAGDVVMVTFPAHSPGGREQEGTRPAVVAGVPSGPLRFPLVMVVPLTTAAGPWQAANRATYPALAAGAGALPKDSIALADQLRAVDRTRLHSYIGNLTSTDYAPIHAAITNTLTLRSP